MEPHVAIIVLSWNGREHTLECLDSLRGARWERLTLIVVDNGSDDGVSEGVAARFPDVVLIRSEENVGFAAGNNLGLEEAFRRGADYALLLNNDTVADPDLVPALVSEARRRPDVGALCPMIYFLDPPDLIWFAGGRFDPRSAHNGTHTGYRERDRGQYHATREIGRATGAAVMVTRAAAEHVGLLDKRLFIQVEDVDWSLRLRAAGFRILFVPDARLWHSVAASSGGETSPFKSYYETRNTLEVCSRHAPLRGWRRTWRELAILGLQLAHTRHARSRVANARAVLEGWRDWRAGRLGQRRAPAESRGSGRGSQFQPAA